MNRTVPIALAVVIMAFCLAIWVIYGQVWAVFPVIMFGVVYVVVIIVGAGKRVRF